VRLRCVALTWRMCAQEFIHFTTVVNLAVGTSTFFVMCAPSRAGPAFAYVNLPLLVNLLTS
jgi:hypothetical protein